MFLGKMIHPAQNDGTGPIAEARERQRRNAYTAFGTSEKKMMKLARKAQHDAQRVDSLGDATTVRLDHDETTLETCREGCVERARQRNLVRASQAFLSGDVFRGASGTGLPLPSIRMLERSAKG